MSDRATLETELRSVRDEIQRQYWAFTRQAHATPVDPALRRREADLEQQLRALGGIVLAEADAALAAVGSDRRTTTRRRSGRPGGRRAIDEPANAWSTGQLAYCIGMSSLFVLDEIRAGEIRASKFGGEYRIAIVEVRRYLETKGWPLPAWMVAA